MPVRRCAVSYTADRQTILTFVDAESVFEAVNHAALKLSLATDAPSTFTVVVGDSDDAYVTTVELIGKVVRWEEPTGPTEWIDLDSLEP